MSEPYLAERRGFNGTIRVYGDYVELDRTGIRVAAFMSGLFGIRHIHFKDVTGITFKRRGLLNGWIKFELSGYIESPGVFSFTTNPNAVSFQDKNAEWAEFYTFLKEHYLDYKRKASQVETILRSFT